jgi:hypothetical protein
MFEFDPNTLYASMLWGALASGLILYGKKQSRAPVLIGGLALIAATFFVYSPLAISVIGFLVIGGIWAACRYGY